MIFHITLTKAKFIYETKLKPLTDTWLLKCYIYRDRGSLQIIYKKNLADLPAGLALTAVYDYHWKIAAGHNPVNQNYSL